MTEAQPAADTTRDTDPTRVLRIVYRSRSRIPAEQRRAVLAQIFASARTNNRRAGVTGALLVTDHYFVQTLEGDEAQVRALFERIDQDDRHDDLVVVEDLHEARVFSRWAMARVAADGGADIPLHATEGGTIGPAARTPLTREQAVLLKRMRNTIGADVV
jgi:predicted sulfurtransferase